jgi:integrase
MPDGTKRRPFGRCQKRKNSKEDAVQLEREAIADLLNPKAAIVAAGGGKTLRELAAEYTRDIAPHQAQSEQESKRHKLPVLLDFEVRPGCLLGSLPISVIGRYELGRLKTYLTKERGLAMATVNNYLAVMGALLSWALDCEWIPKMPGLGMYDLETGDVQEADVYSPAEVDALLKEADADDDIMLRCAILLGFDAGLRAGEIRALHRTDVVGDVLYVRWSDYNGKLVKTKTGKRQKGTDSAKPRVIEMTGRLQAAVKRCLLAQAGPRVLARLNTSQRWAVATGDIWTKEVMRQYKLPKAWHALRHGFVTQLMIAGAPSKYVQDVAGHASVKTQERYTHAKPEDAAKVTRWLPSGKGRPTK